MDQVSFQAYELKLIFYFRAKLDLDSHMIVSHQWKHFCDSLDNKKIIQAPFCGDEDCEEKIKKDSARYSYAVKSGQDSTMYNS